VKYCSLTLRAEEVRAILAGTQHQVRRPLGVQPPAHVDGLRPRFRRPERWIDQNGSDFEVRCPLVVGQEAWAQETWGIADMFLDPAEAKAAFYAGERCWAYTGKVPGSYQIEELCHHVVYRAECDRPFHWRSARRMPQWASRFSLEVTVVRAERLWELTTADMAAEGYARTIGYGPLWFEDWLENWNTAYAKHGKGWDDNPWTWVFAVRPVRRIAPAFEEGS
jgi:hypothetical protein